MLILGIDPGTAMTGYGLIRKHGNRIKPVVYGCILTSKESAPQARLEKIFLGVTGLIESEHRPDIIVVEQLFFNANVKTALAVGEARGVILLAAALAAIPVIEYTPLQVKMTLSGYGRASKEQIQFMVKTLLNLEKPPKPDDVADALALAITYAHTGKVLENVAALT